MSSENLPETKKHDVTVWKAASSNQTEEVSEETGAELAAAPDFATGPTKHEAVAKEGCKRRVCDVGTSRISPLKQKGEAKSKTDFPA